MKSYLAAFLLLLPTALFANGDEPVNYDDPNLSRDGYQNSERIEATLDCGTIDECSGKMVRPEVEVARAIELANKVSNYYGREAAADSTSETTTGAEAPVVQNRVPSNAQRAPK